MKIEISVLYHGSYFYYIPEKHNSIPNAWQEMSSLQMIIHLLQTIMQDAVLTHSF